MQGLWEGLAERETGNWGARNYGHEPLTVGTDPRQAFTLSWPSAQRWTVDAGNTYRPSDGVGANRGVDGWRMMRHDEAVAHRSSASHRLTVINPPWLQRAVCGAQVGAIKAGA